MRAEVRRRSEARILDEGCGVVCGVVCKTVQEEVEIDECVCARSGRRERYGEVRVVQKYCTITTDSSELLMKKVRDADRDLG